MTQEFFGERAWNHQPDLRWWNLDNSGHLILVHFDNRHHVCYLILVSVFSSINSPKNGGCPTMANFMGNMMSKLWDEMRHPWAPYFQTSTGADLSDPHRRWLCLRDPNKPLVPRCFRVWMVSGTPPFLLVIAKKSLRNSSLVRPTWNPLRWIWVKTGGNCRVGSFVFMFKLQIFGQPLVNQHSYLIEYDRLIDNHEDCMNSLYQRTIFPVLSWFPPPGSERQSSVKATIGNGGAFVEDGEYVPSRGWMGFFGTISSS